MPPRTVTSVPGSQAELANRWMERLGEETEDLVHHAVGHIRDVQTLLVYGASQQNPITAIPLEALKVGHGG